VLGAAEQSELVGLRGERSRLDREAATAVYSQDILTQPFASCPSPTSIVASTIYQGEAPFSPHRLYQQPPLRLQRPTGGEAQGGRREPAAAELSAARPCAARSPGAPGSVLSTSSRGSQMTGVSSTSGARKRRRRTRRGHRIVSHWLPEQHKEASTSAHAAASGASASSAARPTQASTAATQALAPTYAGPVELPAVTAVSGSIAEPAPAAAPTIRSGSVDSVHTRSTATGTWIVSQRTPGGTILSPTDRTLQHSISSGITPDGNVQECVATTVSSAAEAAHTGYTSAAASDATRAPGPSAAETSAAATLPAAAPAAATGRRLPGSHIRRAVGVAP